MGDTNQDEKQPDADSNPSNESESTESDGSDESKTVPYSRFKEVNDAKKKLEEQLNASEPEETTTKRSSDSDGDGNYVTKEDFERSRLRDKGYGKETVEFIMRNGGEDALDDPHVAKAVDSMSEQEQAEEAGDVNTSSKSDVSRKYSTDDLRGMSSKEIEEVLSKTQ